MFWGLGTKANGKCIPWPVYWVHLLLFSKQVLLIIAFAFSRASQFAGALRNQWGDRLSEIVETISPTLPVHFPSTFAGAGAGHALQQTGEKSGKVAPRTPLPTLTFVADAGLSLEIRSWAFA